MRTSHTGGGARLGLFDDLTFQAPLDPPARVPVPDTGAGGGGQAGRAGGGRHSPFRVAVRAAHR